MTDTERVAGELSVEQIERLANEGIDALYSEGITPRAAMLALTNMALAYRASLREDGMVRVHADDVYKCDQCMATCVVDHNDAISNAALAARPGESP